MRNTKQFASAIALTALLLAGCGPMDARDIPSPDGVFFADIVEQESGALMPSNRGYTIKVRSRLPAVWIDKIIPYNEYGMGCDPDLEHLNKASASTDFVPYEMESFQPLLLNQQNELEMVFWCRGKIKHVKIWANDGHKKWQSDIRPK